MTRAAGATRRHGRGWSTATRACTIAGMSATAMPDDTRWFRCERCLDMVRICRRCDRGNRYCSTACRREARRESVRTARKLYAQSQQGRVRHRDRQRRYRERLGGESAKPGPRPRAATETSRKVNAAPKKPAGHPVTVHRCHACGRPCCEFIRLGFLTMIRHERGPMRSKRPKSRAPACGKRRTCSMFTG